MVLRRKAYYYSRLLLGAGTLSYVTSFVIFGQRSSTSTLFALRSYNSPADRYYQEHGTIPPPKSMHTTLLKKASNDNNNNAKGILIVGDVHGCLDELQDLHRVAEKANDNHPFQYVILVGDMVNKGPLSAQVVQFIRKKQQQQQDQNGGNWLTVRGNHDLGALAAALGPDTRRQHPKYASWINGLTDDDVQWLADLPYTIRIPVSYWDTTSSSETGMKEDVLIVHAGLIPNMPLEDQTIDQMVTLRKVVTDGNSKEPWATVWKGPEHIVFGHDARLGLQQESHATGLDTGVCYGKKLTGLMLPQRKLVSVDAKEVYSPIVVAN